MYTNAVQLAGITPQKQTAGVCAPDYLRAALHLRAKLIVGERARGYLIDYGASTMQRRQL